MPSYDITIPGRGKFRVTSETELTDEQAYEAALSQSAPQESPASAGRAAGIVARGALPPAAMATAGALMGAPAGPVGSATGALIGGVAIPASDFLVNLYNLASRSDVQLPSSAISDFLNRLGLPQPETRGERMLEAGSGAVTGVGTQLPALQRLAAAATSPVTRGVAEMAGQAPKTQVATAAPAAGTAQYVTEATGSPLAGLAAGVAVGAAPGVRPGRVEQGAELEQVRQKAADAYKIAQKADLYIKPSFVEDILKKMNARLAGTADEPLGYNPRLQPEISIALKAMQDEVDQGRFFSLQSIDNLRQILKAPAGNFNNPNQQRITSELINIFDDSMVSLSPNSVISGDAKAATNAIESARDLYTKQKKLQTVENLVNNASISAGGYSQSGMDNALRVQFAALARNPKRMAQFNKTEREEIKNIAEGGGSAEKIARLLGRFAVRGPVTGAVQAISPFGGVDTIIASEAAKRSAEALRQQNVQRLMDAISLGRTPESRTLELLPATAMRGLLSSQYGME
jgi:hypothetical protein